jgi:hypothetical protein
MSLKLSSAHLKRESSETGFLNCIIILAVITHVGRFWLYIDTTTVNPPPWRNRLARSAVNRKVGGSSPPGGAQCFVKATLDLTTLFSNSVSYQTKMMSISAGFEPAIF